ncbi:hypothetical protein ACFVTX_09960 [Agromyces sp. NPDC058136]|uniref:hypothetical protein n=1 Tax=Agromyces sp. NPDC058136 TaxID=3346354 RepID=UPI0036D97BBB
MTDPAPPQYGVRVPSVEPGVDAAAPEPMPTPGWGPAPDAPEPERRRPRGAIVAISLLVVALLAAAAGGVWLFLQLSAVQAHVVDQQEQLEEQQHQIDEQQELIDEKEVFGAAMTGLLDSAARFDGVLTGDVVPWEDYLTLADQAWMSRWNADELAAQTLAVDVAATQLDERWNAAQQHAASNSTGTTYESVIDRLSGGFVASVIDDADLLCDQGDVDVLACVISDDPYLVHFDAAANGAPYMTDEIRTGIAYHEFAHVLQLTNPTQTSDALAGFGGDVEVMADCFALTFLDGWKLDHRVWTSGTQYWDVNVGYGVECSAEQRQAVRDWHASLGVELRPITASMP